MLLSAECGYVRMLTSGTAASVKIVHIVVGVALRSRSIGAAVLCGRLVLVAR